MTQALQDSVFNAFAVAPTRYSHPASEVLAFRDPIDLLALRLHRDRFNMLAMTEPKTQGLGEVGNNKALCSYCLDLHLRSLFSTEELAKPPSERVCIGAQATFHICPHNTPTFKELMAIIHKGNFPASFPDGECAEVDCNTSISRSLREPKSKDRLEFERCMVFMLPAGQGNVPEGEEDRRAKRRYHQIIGFDHDVIRDGLHRLDAYICPHMRSSNPAVFKGLEDQLNKACAQVIDFELKEQDELEEDDINISGMWTTDVYHVACNVEACHAFVALEWQTYPGCMHLTITRHVGWCTVASEEWLVSVDVGDT